MLGIRLHRRNAVLALGTILLAGCAVVPKTTPPTKPVEEPDASVLPTDGDRHRIALLVPTTGTNADVGKSLANATTLALLDTNASNLRITTYDTGAGANAAAKRAIADGNRLVIGPLLGNDTKAITAVTRPAGVPLISFSNDVSTAAHDVFLMGHVPDQSIERTISYAHSKGARNFAALIPTGEYGKRAEAALSATILRKGASLVALERYDRGNTSITAAANRLIGKGGFDTVLIADGAQLSVFAAQVFAAMPDKPRLLGTELWSGETRIASSTAVRGAWFSAVSDGRFKRFSDSYASRFGAQPYRISTLGYDAVLLTLRIARNWSVGKPFPTIDMRDKGGFLGLDGPFRFGPNGVGQRAMEVREVTANGMHVVSAAPARFED